MAVYTAIERDELAEFLRDYPVGDLIEYRGIGEGVENTNYFVTTAKGRYVFTLFESIGYADLPYYLDLMAFLAEHGVPSAHPVADRAGHYLRDFKHRPAALVQRLEGVSVTAPTPRQCQAIGRALGHLHRVGQAFAGRRDHTRGPDWRQATGMRLLPHLNREDAAILRDELDYQSAYDRAGLPSGVIHADLFRDNALFRGDELTGIIDFYYACNGVLLYDLAVTVNDWCVRADYSLETDKARGLLTAYREQRPLQESERAIWPMMLRVAALRFWLSRLQDQLFPRPGALTRIKDPDEFKRLLRWHAEHPDAARDSWAV